MQHTTIDLQPIPNEPALFEHHHKLLFIADLHIGIETELQQNGLHIPSQTHHMTTRLIKLINRYHPTHLIILGDIKHTIPNTTIQERIDVKKFLTTISHHLPIHIIPGNHDGNIHWHTPNNTTIHPNTGTIFHTIGCLHGHTWPTPDLLTTTHLILGHTHPLVQLTDRLNYRTYEPIWVKGILDTQPLKNKYPNTTSPNIIILPTFNPLCGGVAINQETPLGPIAKHLNPDHTHLYLLDGTDLGTITQLTKH